MLSLKSALKSLLQSKMKIDWLIILELAEYDLNIQGIAFSFVEGEKRTDVPFGTNQGYLSLKNDALIAQLNSLIYELYCEFYESSIALSNLFIILNRVSYYKEEKDKLVAQFLSFLSDKQKKEIFELLIDSLNSEYFRDRYNSFKNPLTADDWLVTFRSAQFVHSISDPILNCLKLVRKKKDKNIRYSHIKQMKPVIRAVLMSWYGFDLTISHRELKTLFNNETEISFLAACLIDDTGSDKISPSWLNQELVFVFIIRYWNTVGKYIFRNIFGISIRNKNCNEIYQKLGEYSHTVLLENLVSTNSTNIEWLKYLTFPNDFIALYSWFADKSIDLSKIPIGNCMKINEQFINELDRIFKDVPCYLSKEYNSNPFLSYQIHDEKYLTSLAFQLYFLLSNSKNLLKKFRNLCYQFKLLFYGSYDSVYLAKQYTELILLILLSAFRINKLDKAQKKVLEEYLAIISDSILIPYVHLLEREHEIWSNERNNSSLIHNNSILVINYMKDSKEGQYCYCYIHFFNTIDEVTVQDWTEIINR